MGKPMAMKNLKVSGPIGAPPVLAKRSRVKPRRSRNARSTSVCASQLVRPRSTAFSPRFTPHANMRRLKGEASMIWARTLAAICSHTRGGQEHEGRRDLPEIGHDGIRFLDEVDLVAAHERLIERLELLADPSHGQQRDVLVVGAEIEQLAIGGDVRDEPARGETGELGIGGGAGGRAEHGDVRAGGLVDEAVPQRRLGGSGLAGGLQQRVAFDEPGVGVFAHAARIAVDDLLHRRDAGRDAQHLVDLLLVLGDDDLGLGIGDEIAHLRLQPVLVETEALGADGVGGDGGR